MIRTMSHLDQREMTMSKYKFGIDISTWQKPHLINYDLVASQIEFVVLRCGFTGSARKSLEIDAEFERHYSEFSKRNTPIGVYWYSRAVNYDEGVAEALKVLELIKNKKIEYPVFWDTEDNVYQGPASRQSVTNAAKGFCETIEKSGYFVSIYASTSWLNSQLDMDQLKQYDVWVAHYGVLSPSYRGRYGMWQYTDKGRLKGYSGNLDLNRSYRDYKAIISNAGLNHLKKPLLPSNPVYASYKVKKGDTLYQIARSLPITWPELYALNKETIGSNPDKIKVGMVLKVPKK